MPRPCACTEKPVAIARIMVRIWFLFDIVLILSGALRMLKKPVAFPTSFALARVSYETLHKCNNKVGC
jgi:hypothetical protein